MKALGVMQGRLLPLYLGRYQAFPVHDWQREFIIAKELGLDCIEFVFDRDSALLNPLLNAEGVEEINALIKKTGVKVLSVCADYFMSLPLFAVNKINQKKSLETLMALIRNAKLIGITDIVIPAVDESSLVRSPYALKILVESLQQAIPLAESLEVNSALETDLAPKPFLGLLKTLGSKCIKVNYDTGNSAYWGYDVREEMATYGSYVSSVHIKDRERFGGPVVLGEGDADIDLALSELRQCNFQGCIIMQAFRDEEGIEIFKQQLNWFKPILEKYYSQAESRIWN